MLPPLLSYNDQRSTGNIMGTPENYNSPYHIYRIHSQELPPNTVAKVPPIHKQQKYPNEYDKILHQIEVAPSIITRLIISFFVFFFFFFSFQKIYRLILFKIIGMIMMHL